MSSSAKFPEPGSDGIGWVSRTCLFQACVFNQGSLNYQFSQFNCSVVSDSLRPCGLQQPGLPVHHQLPEFAQTPVHWGGDAIQPSHPLLSPPPPPIPSSIRVFSNESAFLMRWPKYWSFSFSISPSNEHPGLISFRMDWLDLFAVQGTLKSLLQHYSSKASILQAQLSSQSNSHPYMTTGKTIALTRPLLAE